jgi:putative oxidoreductase
MLKTSFGGVECRGEFSTIELRRSLQRLFSTFPNGWPGFGLLLLRLGVGTALIYASLLEKTQEPITVAQQLISAGTGVFLLAGLWTPVMGSLAGLDQAWIVFSRDSSNGGGRWLHIFLIVLSLSVAMLGPGAWSIDARLFGRRRFHIDGGRGR